MTRIALAALMLALAACSGAPKKSSPPPATAAAKPVPVSSDARRSPHAPAQEDLSKRGDYVAEGLYAPHIRDGAPSQDPQVDLIPEVQPKAEPRSRYGNRPYRVLGKPYGVMGDDEARRYSETGMASWYGAKFHGRRTSSLEVYDMYTFSGAHKTLPLPSYVRVTNLDNGKSLVVRVNDRGPFHPGRIIDLSYAAAMKLGVNRTGTAKVHVQAIDAGHEDADTRMASIAAPARAMPPTPSAANPLPATGAAATAIDALVAAMPIAAAEASQREPITRAPPAGRATAPDQDYRFDMRQDGRAMTAAEFDAWMKVRRVHVATGKPGRPDARLQADAAAPSPTALAPASPPPSAGIPRTQPIASAARSGAVTLQVASFSSQQNAGRALTMLQGAGIHAARLQDAQVNGQKFWRLRVGPLDGAAATELSSRIAGLGFGAPRVVTD